MSDILRLILNHASTLLARAESKPEREHGISKSPVLPLSLKARPDTPQGVPVCYAENESARAEVLKWPLLVLSIRK